MTVDHSACDNGGKQVCCDRCGAEYVCTPERDLYCTPQGDHCCEPCLMSAAAVSCERGIVEALERWQRR